MRTYKNLLRLGRSRKGAWIEITTPQGNLAAYGRRSRKGAWIEINAAFNSAGSVESLP